MALRRKRIRRLLVTGGAGFLGRHVVTHPLTERSEAVAPGSRSLDLRDRDAVIDAVRAWKPSVIIHTAYRRDERGSIVDATANVAEAAVAVGARLVHVSTDALFAGQLAMYTELDPPAPVHDYGRHKADAEAAVSGIDPGAVIVRTSLLYGTDELSIHERMVHDAATGVAPMTFFTDEIRSPVLVGDLAAALLDLGLMPEVTGVINLGGPTALSRAELAVMTARRHGWNESALRFSTIAESGMTRPSKVVLDSGKAARHGLGVRGPDSWT